MRIGQSNIGNHSQKIRNKISKSAGNLKNTCAIFVKCYNKFNLNWVTQ